MDLEHHKHLVVSEQNFCYNVSDSFECRYKHIVVSVQDFGNNVSDSFECLYKGLCTDVLVKLNWIWKATGAS